MVQKFLNAAGYIHLKGDATARSLFPVSVFLRPFLCLRSAGLPGDGGWYEVKCDVAMASVTLGDCKQGLHWTWAEAGRWEDAAAAFLVEH